VWPPEAQALPRAARVPWSGLQELRVGQREKEDGRSQFGPDTSAGVGLGAFGELV
jgi:hypothetical protein